MLTAEEIARYFPDHAEAVASYRDFRQLTRFARHDPSAEYEAAAFLASRGMAPIQGLTAAQSVHFRAEQLHHAPPEVRARAAQALGVPHDFVESIAEHARKVTDVMISDALSHTDDPEIQTVAAEMLAQQGIRSEGESPAVQLKALHDAATRAGTHYAQVAQDLGLDAPPGVRAAERERALRGDKENSALHGLLESAEFQAAAEEAFRTHAADLAKLQIATIPGRTPGHALLKGAMGLTDPSLINQYRNIGDEKIDAEGYFAEVAKLSGGAFGDADQTRRFLESVAQGELHDRLFLRQRERDAERNGGKPEAAEPARPPQDDWRSALEAQLAKQERQRPAVPARMRTVDVPSEKRAEPAAYLDNDTRADMEFAWRKANGESLEGIQATPKVKAEFLRRPAESLRERSYRGAGEGKAETWRDALSHSWDRLEIQESGGDVGAFDAGTEAAGGAADALESEAGAAESEAA